MHDPAKLHGRVVGGAVTQHAFARVVQHVRHVVGRGHTAIQTRVVVFESLEPDDRIRIRIRAVGIAGRRIRPLPIGHAQVQDLERHVLPDTRLILQLDLDEPADIRRARRRLHARRAGPR